MVAFYLVSMGRLYREPLRRLGHGAAVDEVLAANPTARTFDVPESARGLLDEHTLWSGAEHARATLDRWYDAGAQTPALTLPPNRPVEELDFLLESMRPALWPGRRRPLAALRTVTTCDRGDSQYRNEVAGVRAIAASVVSASSAAR